MATLEEVLAAIDRIEKSGHTGGVIDGARLEISGPMPSPKELDGVLDELRSAYPGCFPPGPPPKPPPGLPGRPIPPSDQGPGQQGAAAQAMKKAEAALSHVQSATAEFDRQVIEALLHAHKTTEEGREQLDALEAEIVGAARGWDLGTAAGAREFQQFLIGKLRQIIAVVQETNDDDASKQALAAAWAALYASQTGQEGSHPGGSDGAPGRGAAPSERDASKPEVFPDTDMDAYLDGFPEDELEPVGAGAAVPSAAIPPAAPPVPSLGEGMPAGGSMPLGGMPGGLPLAGPLADLQRRPAPERLDDEPVPDDDLMSAQDASSGQPGDDDTDDETVAPEPAAVAGPTTVTLPNGETVTVATPRLAAVLQSAADGTPVAEAFRRQGITIPPPGTAVTAAVDQSRIGPGDIGMFTDRHALALGSGKALLDGQIQHIANVRGPSFLGWQHPPTLEETTTPTRTPTPTRPSATVTA